MASSTVNTLWLAVYFSCLRGFVLCEDSCVKGTSCRCTETNVDCSNLSLSTVPSRIPLSTISLDLSKNVIREVDFSSLSNLKSLRELILHNNNLKSVPPWGSLPSSLVFLSLHHNKITSLPAANNTKHLSLKTLLLNSNRIASIDKDAFVNFTNLEQLKLGKNKLRAIPGALDHLPSLTFLDLSKNFIENITSPFPTFSSLRTLKLSRNKLNRITNHAFWSLTSLEKLFLDQNSLAAVSTAWFFNLHSLQKLYLNNNRISKITFDHGTDWRQVPLLNDLNLAGNDLSVLDASTFRHLSSLQLLNLGGNVIYHIAERTFADLHYLSSLDLRNNNIQSTVDHETGAFTGLSNVIFLRLDGNRITSIAAGAFSGLEKVQSLNLSSNVITSIADNAFSEMKHLASLHINSTMFLCDCHLQWLSSWLRTKAFDSTVHAVCLLPRRLERKSIFNVSSSEFICDKTYIVPRIIEHPQAEKVYLGENVTLRCVAKVTAGNDSGFEILWKRENQFIQDGNIFTSAKALDKDTVTYTSQLIMRGVDYTDDGFYQCIAKNQFGTFTSKLAQLTVLVYPTLIEKPKDVSVKAGDSFELSCKANGHPEPSIKLQREGVSTFPAALTKRMDLIRNKVFLIKNATAADMGLYTCIAENAAGSVNASAYVTVLDKPRFVGSMRSKSAQVGHSIVLECAATGSPKPSVTWYKNNGPLRKSARIVTAMDGQLLVVIRVDEPDQGEYTCKVSNTQGTIRQRATLTVTSDVTAAPCLTDPAGIVRYDKKTFLGIIVIIIVSCIVCTSVVWLLIIYCARLPRKQQYKTRIPFEPDTSDEANVAAFPRENIRCYIPLTCANAGSTQNGRESPRSTATCLTSSGSQTTSFPRSASSSENASGSDKTSSGDNESSENSLKGSRSSIVSSCPSDAPGSFAQPRGKANVQSSDSESEKQCKIKKTGSSRSGVITNPNREHLIVAPDKQQRQTSKEGLLCEDTDEGVSKVVGPEEEEPLTLYRSSVNV